MKMKWKQFVAIPLFSTVMGCMVVAAQEPAAQQYPDPTQRAANNAPPADFRSEPFAVPLEWTPPALEQLSSQAAVKSSFTLDRTLLALAAGILPDSEADDRRALNKLDGISVHSMRFGDAGIPDERAVEAVRAAYHLRGWKHLVSTTKAGGQRYDRRLAGARRHQCAWRGGVGRNSAKLDAGDSGWRSEPGGPFAPARSLWYSSL
jgi:hypothetical protein